MAAKCYSCGKGIQIGHNVSHSKRRTRKIWRANLQSYRLLMQNGQRQTVKLCVKCLRDVKEATKKMLQKQTVAKIHAPNIPPPANVL